MTNAALPNPPVQAKRKMYLNLLDQFTEWHLRMLKLFRDPMAALEPHGYHRSLVNCTSRAGVLVLLYPHLAKERTFYYHVWRELYQSGLVSRDEITETMPQHMIIENALTDRGREFLSLISDPEFLADGLTQ